MYVNEWRRNWCRDTVWHVPLKFLPSSFPPSFPLSRFLLFYFSPRSSFFLSISFPLLAPFPRRFCRWKNICRRGNAVSNPAEFHEYSRSNKCCEFKRWRFGPTTPPPLPSSSLHAYISRKRKWLHSYHPRPFAFVHVSFYSDFGNIRRPRDTYRLAIVKGQQLVDKEIRLQ